ncbi:MAG: hypothetical protein A4E70_00369 [Syntrophus sp. PtaU1.Bin005]|jgi:hypothetical protein|uniref:hypothetical protein n=1 Tax=Syntrophus sp. (in: bacteria) TaxID=48412 RepID=UPI0009D07C60|nr:MAG: hypothetical protein A4E69_02036 [Syntrophus sp. PtaB.Bin138]OPY83196.1 MAG: hypothetical protein A4E70_00369 [Syntrophus sp. PtaU1.Bin005]
MVRPIDIQQIVSQVEAIEKIHHVQKQQSSIQQNYIETQLKEEQKLAREKVQDSSKTERALIRDREESTKHNMPQRKSPRTQKQDEDTENEEDGKSAGKGKFVNIKI